MLLSSYYGGKKKPYTITISLVLESSVYTKSYGSAIQLHTFTKSGKKESHSIIILYYLFVY